MVDGGQIGQLMLHWMNSDEMRVCVDVSKFVVAQDVFAFKVRHVLIRLVCESRTVAAVFLRTVDIFDQVTKI